MKLRDVSGYDVLLTALKQGPISFDHADSTLKKALNVDWKTKNQTMFRMNWLRSLGYVTKDGHDYSLTPSGQSLVASGSSPVDRQPAWKRAH
jgi:predicted transcriptional regulator